MQSTYSINCNGKLVSLEKPLIMGILNLTKDSFFDGGKYLDENNRNAQINKMILDGADIIDLGAMSSRPNAKISNPNEEIDKVIPALNFIKQNFENIIVSIDTVHAKVAEVALENNADIINDISGGMFDENMIPTVAKYNAPYVLMHMIGTPETMQKNTSYKNIIHDIIDFFNQQTSKCYQYGIKDVILDIGIGFSKTTDQNFFLINNLDAFKFLEKPLLIGLSNKSLIYKTLNIDKQEAANGTTTLNTFAIANGINILRVHDVKNAKQIVTLMHKINHIKY